MGPQTRGGSPYSQITNPNTRRVYPVAEGDSALLTVCDDAVDRPDSASIPNARFIPLECSKLIEALLDKGANVNAATMVGVDSLGMAADSLGMAAAWNYTDSVKILLAHRANPNTTDVDGCTPLMSAATHGNAEMEEVLLQTGASIDVQDKDGNTALMNAVKCTYGEKHVQVLIHYGAKVNLKNNDGETALRQVRGWVLPKIVHLLKQAGAKE